MINEQRGNLPAARGPLVGRGDLERTVRQLVPVATPVTLIGPGGVGKTHLAIHAAHALHAELDSAWMVDLSSLSGEVSVARLCAHLAVELGIRHFGDAGLEVVLSRLRPEKGSTSTAPALLVLDTCDRVIPQVRTVVLALMQALPQLRIMATCRERLALDGEHVVIVPPLRTDDSADLFVQLAVASGAEDGDLDPGDVRELCRRLDGLPLAVKLAAGRARALTTRELIDRVEDRFSLLTDATGSRHSGLDTVVDLSYESCERHEQLVWQRCSVFAGDFTLTAAEAVAGHDGLNPAAVVDATVRLVDKSVFTRLAGPGPARYRLLDTLRDYGLRKLDESGTTRQARSRHSDHYRAVLAHAAATWFGPDELTVMATVRDSLHDTIAAVDHLIAIGDLAAAAAICRDSTRTRAPFFWGYLDILIGQLHRIIDRTPAPVNDAAAHDLAATLATEAWVTGAQGRHELSRGLLGRARDVLAQRDLPVNAVVLFAAGGSGFLLDADREATGLLAAARDLFAGPALAGDRHMSTMIWAISTGFAGLTVDAGVVADAATTAASVTASDRYRAEAERAGAPWAVTWALWSAALTALRDDDLDLATDLIGRCLRAQRDMTDLWGQTWSLELAAWILAAGLRGVEEHARRRAEAERAAWLLGAARERQKELGVQLSGMRPLATGRALARAAITGVLGEADTVTAITAGAHAPEHAMRIALDERVSRHPDDADRGVGDGLTVREREIVALLATGLRNAEIAQALRISVLTVQTHLRNAYAKAGVSSRVEMVAAWTAHQSPI